MTEAEVFSAFVAKWVGRHPSPSALLNSIVDGEHDVHDVSDFIAVDVRGDRARRGGLMTVATSG